VYEPIVAVQVVDQVVDDIERMTVVQLKAVCKTIGLTGVSKMRKAELLELLREPVVEQVCGVCLENRQCEQKCTRCNFDICNACYSIVVRNSNKCPQCRTAYIGDRPEVEEPVEHNEEIGEFIGGQYVRLDDIVNESVYIEPVRIATFFFYNDNYELYTYDTLRGRTAPPNYYDMLYDTTVAHWNKEVRLARQRMNRLLNRGDADSFIEIGRCQQRIALYTHYLARIRIDFPRYVVEHPL
jgi:hypothetical protein